MSKSAPNLETVDVLSSIRRLVSQDNKTAEKTVSTQADMSSNNVSPNHQLHVDSRRELAGRSEVVAQSKAFEDTPNSFLLTQDWRVTQVAEPYQLTSMLVPSAMSFLKKRQSTNEQGVNDSGHLGIASLPERQSVKDTWAEVDVGAINMSESDEGSSGNATSEASKLLNLLVESEVARAIQEMQKDASSKQISSSDADTSHTTDTYTAAHVKLAKNDADSDLDNSSAPDFSEDKLDGQNDEPLILNNALGLRLESGGELDVSKDADTTTLQVQSENTVTPADLADQEVAEMAEAEDWEELDDVSGGNAVFGRGSAEANSTEGVDSTRSFYYTEDGTGTAGMAQPDPAGPADVIDEDVLRAMVGDMIRKELQGALGERITMNVRKLVRREILRALQIDKL